MAPFKPCSHGVCARCSNVRRLALDPTLAALGLFRKDPVFPAPGNEVCGLWVLLELERVLRQVAQEELFITRVTRAVDAVEGSLDRQRVTLAVLPTVCPHQALTRA